MGEDKPSFSDDVTKERIPEFDGDRLFYFVYETRNDKTSKQAEPLWQNLPAAKACKAVPIDEMMWNTDRGVIAANLSLDDIAHTYDVAPAK